MLRIVVGRSAFHRLVAVAPFIDVMHVAITTNRSAMVGRRIDIAEYAAIVAVIHDSLPHASPWQDECHPGGTVLLTRKTSELDPRAQRLGHAPRLRDAAPRRERLGRVEHFPYRSDARLVHVRQEPVERAMNSGHIVWMDLQPRVDERTDEPSPHRALVIRGIA